MTADIEYFEFKLLENKAEDLLQQKKTDKEKAEAISILHEIKDILIVCKLRGVMPPYGLIEIARKLANQFPELSGLIAEIIKTEHEIMQAISEKAGIPLTDLREFQKLLATDPLKAAEYYFNLDVVKTMHETGDKIRDEKSPLPSDAEYEQHKLNLENTKEMREALAPALVIEAEVLRQRGESSKLAQCEEYLEDLGQRIIDATVMRKHYNKPNKEREIHDVRQIDQIFNKNNIFYKDVAAVPEHKIDHFVINLDANFLKEAIEIAKNLNKEKAETRIQEENQARAKREAEEAAKILRETIQKTDQVEQQEQIKEEVQVIEKIDREIANKGDKTKTVEMEDDLDAFLDDEPQPPSPPKEPHKFTPEIMRANKITSSNHLAPSITSGQKPSKTQGHGH